MPGTGTGETYGFTEDYLLKVLKKKPVSPDSSARPQTFQSAHIDALSAILLHYDLFTYSIAPGGEGMKSTLSMDIHPLAWLLMLCDELQCWDRTAYGRNSRNELHPMAVEFDFSDNRLLARYQYDEKEQEEIECIAPMEHERWVREHQSMGWSCDDFYEHVPVPRNMCEKEYRAAIREQSRCHTMAIDGELSEEKMLRRYRDCLSESEKYKDFQPFNCMLRLIRRFDGLRIYRFVSHEKTQ